MVQMDFRKVENKKIRNFMLKLINPCHQTIKSNWVCKQIQRLQCRNVELIRITPEVFHNLILSKSNKRCKSRIIDILKEKSLLSLKHQVKVLMLFQMAAHMLSRILIHQTVESRSHLNM